MTIHDVKPALRFLAVFLGTYLVLSVSYGLWIESLGSLPDPMTSEVTREVVAVINVFSTEDVTAVRNPLGPTVFVIQGERKVLNVYEGCNGINVMVVFFAFVMAYGGRGARLLWFVPAGFMAIHLANLGRVLWLFWLSAIDARLFYYFHKYLFTAVIYLMVFALWWLWVTRWNGLTKPEHAR